ncbi:MAG TPA: hypothetical protein PLL77_04565 [Pyrinomonadaceae bacterium]|nr:hypothetical protein [Pyrinomonadaceae bacterium]
MKTISTAILLVAITALTMFATGCPQRTSIADIEANPGKYQDKEVVVAGTVRDSYGLSIPGTRIGGGAYKIDDGTGAIWVLVTDGAVPQKGAEVGVRGRLGTGVNWKGRNYGLGIYEKDRRYGKK